LIEGNLEASIQTLTRAKDLRSRLLKRVQVEQPDIVLEQKQLTAKVKKYAKLETSGNNGNRINEN
jgi:hypothetical protein